MGSLDLGCQPYLLSLAHLLDLGFCRQRTTAGDDSDFRAKRGGIRVATLMADSWLALGNRGTHQSGSTQHPAICIWLHRMDRSQREARVVNPFAHLHAALAGDNRSMGNQELYRLRTPGVPAQQLL